MKRLLYIGLMVIVGLLMFYVGMQYGIDNVIQNQIIYDEDYTETFYFSEYNGEVNMYYYQVEINE